MLGTHDSYRYTFALAIILVIIQIFCSSIPTVFTCNIIKIDDFGGETGNFFLGCNDAFNKHIKKSHI